MGIRWTVTPTQAFDNAVALYADAIRVGVKAIADRYAAEIEAYMKDSAIWRDATGNARQSLNTEVQQTTEDMVTIILAHGVDYGLWLELAHASRFAVIAPTLDVFGPRVWADVQALMR